MEYGINVKFFKPDIGIHKAVELVAKAGFTKIDFTPDVSKEDWEDELREAAKLFGAYGLTVHQTHIPFNRYGRYGDMHKTRIDRCAEASEAMGAKFMVAHGDEFDFANMEFSPEAALEYNHDYFLPYVERAKRNGYKIAFETVFEDWDRRRFSSDAGELKSLIMSFDSDAAVCCWDFGHAHVTFGKKAPEVIRDFAGLIQCTHLHDNTGMDSHQLPMTGDINWTETIGAFKEIGYNGVMSVEYSHGHMPEHIAAPFIDLTYKTAEHLWTL